MKTFLLLFLFVFSCAVNAQHILTKSANEPLPGDVFTDVEYDTTVNISRATGTNQTWNFSSCVQTTNNATATFSANTAVPESSLFPGTNLVQSDAAGTYTMYKVTTTPTTQVEMLGFYDIPNSSPTTFTNTAIIYRWPITSGTTFSDTFSGPIDIGNNTTAPLNGTVITTGSGTGNLILPGGAQINNVLQVKSDFTLKILIAVPPLTFTQTVKETVYQYYHASQKFPLVTQVDDKITIGSILGSTVDVAFVMSVNQKVAVGITEQNYDATFQILPNPARDAIKITFPNLQNEPLTVKLFNALGQEVKQLYFPNNTFVDSIIDLKDLDAGWYTVQTKWGNRVANRKLLVY
jgi:hypothetical protein